MKQYLATVLVASAVGTANAADLRGASGCDTSREAEVWREGPRSGDVGASPRVVLRSPFSKSVGEEACSLEQSFASFE
jgi:hypothetical protein